MISRFVKASANSARAASREVERTSILLVPKADRIMNLKEWYFVSMLTLCEVISCLAIGKRSYFVSRCSRF